MLHPAGYLRHLFLDNWSRGEIPEPNKNGSKKFVSEENTNFLEEVAFP
jgi:hypothetical protein